MNTSEVAKQLGVSKRTVLRWIKQCHLQLEKNELGHYMYSEADLQVITAHKEKMTAATPEESKPKLRTGKVSVPIEPNGKPIVMEKNRNIATSFKRANAKNIGTDKQITEKLSMIERRLENKADSVVEYQLLQHRKEIEELENQIKRLTERITKLEMKKEASLPAEESPLIDEPNRKKTTKKRNLISMLFSF